MKIHKEVRTTILIVIVTIAVILAVIITFSLYNFWILTIFGAAALVDPPANTDVFQDPAAGYPD